MYGRISIVIPAFNEEKNIPPLYKGIKEVLDTLTKDYELIFVDDGSTDNTFKILEDINKKDSKLKIIKFRKNFGQTAALDAGIKLSSKDIIVTMDADLQNDPADIPKLLEKLNQGFDVVSGWRFKRKDSFSKILFSKLANRLRRFLTNEKIHDSGCSLKAYRKECFKDLDLYGEMHRYIPALLYWKGYRIGEVKIKHSPRKFGETKYGLKRLLNGFLDLLVVKFWMQYSARPIHLFGGFGLLLASIGLLLGLVLVILKFLYGISLADRNTPLLSVFLIILGAQFFISGILADILIKNYYGKTKKNYNIEKVLT